MTRTRSLPVRELILFPCAVRKSEQSVVLVSRNGEVFSPSTHPCVELVVFLRLFLFANCKFYSPPSPVGAVVPVVVRVPAPVVVAEPALPLLRLLLALAAFKLYK